MFLSRGQQVVVVEVRGAGGVLTPPSLDCEPVGVGMTEVCDAWPVRCQIYGHLPSRRASTPLDLLAYTHLLAAWRSG